MFRALLLALAVVATATAPLAGQSARDVGALETEDRVRIASDDVSGEFLVMEVADDELVLRADSLSSRVLIPTASLAKIEISRGLRSRGNVVAGGVLTGVGVFFISASVWPTETKKQEFCWFTGGCGTSTTTGPKGGMGAAALGSAVIGVTVGTVVGVLMSRERWEEIRIPNTVSTLPGEGGGVTVRYSPRF